MEQPNATENSKSKEKPKLKVFETIQTNLATIGITSNLANQSYPFNRIILMGFLMLGSAISSISVFIVCAAETLDDFTQSICAWSMVTLAIICLLILILKVEKLFEFINGCDDLVNTSESTPLWEN